MLLPQTGLDEVDIPAVLDTVKTHFPHLADWEYHNDGDDYLGFTVCVEFTLRPDEEMAPRFFITFSLGPDGWQGDVTVGKPAYFWTSADVGDAYLLNTPPCATLEEAIVALRQAMRAWVRAVAGA
ncbi:MAG TPA: hypothetical protein P5102_14630 [Candidatus Competibacteraceae bacterium]|nr:hypothetical protein [Candidatus Competibacteraceae bacterium]